MKRLFYLILGLYIASVALTLIAALIVGFPKKAVVRDPWLSTSENDGEIIVKSLDAEGKIIEVPLEEYICGVVAAEMPANYPLEALKAQAVAARSYVIYRIRLQQKSPGIIPEHKGADVCTNPAHCKAYITKEEALEKWGEQWYNKYWRNVADSVAQTAGEVVAYNSVPANALFHAASSGKTENAAEIWGQKIPYLVGVESAGDRESPWYISQRQFTKAEFEQLVRASFPDAKFDGEPSAWVSDIRRTSAGSVKQAKLCGVYATGEDFREIFGLKSANFEVEYADGIFVFTTHGYGHGVGMSQYGAKCMAESGNGYVTILKHYYSGTEIMKISDLKN